MPTSGRRRNDMLHPTMTGYSPAVLSFRDSSNHRPSGVTALRPMVSRPCMSWTGPPTPPIVSSLYASTIDASQPGWAMASSSMKHTMSPRALSRPRFRADDIPSSLGCLTRMTCPWDSRSSSRALVPSSEGPSTTMISSGRGYCSSRDFKHLGNHCTRL